MARRTPVTISVPPGAVATLHETSEKAAFGWGSSRSRMGAGPGIEVRTGTGCMSPRVTPVAPGDCVVTVWAELWQSSRGDLTG